MVNKIFTYYYFFNHRSSGDGRFRPLTSSNELPAARSRAATSSTSQPHLQHHPQQQQQQQHPFVTTRVDQLTSRHQATAMQPVRQSPAAGWLPERKSSAIDDDSLDRLVEINTRPLANRGNASTRSSPAVRRPLPTTSVVASPSTLYGRVKPLPVTNNVAKPFSIGRNY